MIIKPKRKIIRLKGFDYAREGYYFVTIDVEHKLKLWGKIREGKMILSRAGEMVEKCLMNGWDVVGAGLVPARMGIENADESLDTLAEKIENTGDHEGRPYIRKNCPYEIDQYMVMPDHVHIIIKIVPMKNKIGLGRIIGAFKSITTDEYIRKVKFNHWPRFYRRLWQRNYYERIIRNRIELEKVRKYIQNNPINFEDK